MERNTAKGNDVDEEVVSLNLLEEKIGREEFAIISSAAKDIRKNYSKKVVDKLSLLSKNSLRTLAKHFQTATTDNPEGQDTQQDTKDIDDQVYDVGDIVFVLTTHLSMPLIEVRPSVDELQNLMVTVGKMITYVMKGVSQWKKVGNKSGKISTVVPNCESKKEKLLYN